MTRAAKLAVLGVAAAVTAAVAPTPTADLTILAHDVRDPAPHRAQFALDAGLLAVKVLVTWTSGGLAR